jgi:hypothetical protein
VHADPTDHLIMQKTLQLGVLQGEGEALDMDHLNSLQDEVNNLIEMEDLKWKQQAKQNWFQHGDRNSKFFHACVNQRRKKNLIQQITDSAGILCTEQGDIEEAFFRYYTDLFQSIALEGVEGCLSGMSCRVTAEMNESLLKPCTIEEVGLAL